MRPVPAAVIAPHWRLPMRLDLTRFGGSSEFMPSSAPSWLCSRQHRPGIRAGRRRAAATGAGSSRAQGRCQEPKGKRAQKPASGGHQGRAAARLRGLRRHAGGRAPRHPDRPDLDRRLRAASPAPSSATLGRRREGVPAKATGPRKPASSTRGARRARRRRQGGAGAAAGASSTTSPAPGRHSDQAGAASGAPARPARAGARRGARCRSRRSAISGPGPRSPAVFERRRRIPPQPQGRTSALRPDFFVLSGLQGLKTFLRARLHSGQRGARHHHPVRPGDPGHHGPGGGRDVERIRCPSHR